METVPLWLPFVFVAIALLYSSAGFGGGSAYLAVLTVAGVSYQVIPQISLLCNIVVTAGGVWHFHRGGHLDFRRVLPFFILSIPPAYAGGHLEVSPVFFNALLGVLLVLAGARMLMPSPGESNRRKISTRDQWIIGLPLGAVLGFVSGMAGIGGGVFLAPVLVLTGWTTSKQSAAAASLFILVNSVAGLIGHLVKEVHVDLWVIPLVAAALVGGQVGSRLGSYHLSSRGVRTLLAAVILVVGIRILWKVI
jgi:uncharacterized membrane protein YfcA